jgi:anti-anti-sigma factor
MSDSQPTPFEPHAPTRLAIEVRLDRAGRSGYTAVVGLCGEHDLGTAVDVQDALEAVWGDVLVDLTECLIIDSTVISVLIRDHQSRRREGQRLELLVPAENATICRTLDITGLRASLPIHARVDDARAQAAS